jgi:hypothetical protein
MRAARLSRTRSFEARQIAFRDSAEGVKSATQALQQFEKRIEVSIADAVSVDSTLSSLKAVKVRNDLIVTGLGPVIVIVWENLYANTLEHSKLHVEFCDRLPKQYARLPIGSKHRVLHQVELTFGLLPPDRERWIAPAWNREFGSEELADEVLKWYMDFAQTWKRPEDY